MSRAFLIEATLCAEPETGKVTQQTTAETSFLVSLDIVVQTKLQEGGSFTSFFSTWVCFISSPIALARTFKTMLSKSGESRDHKAAFLHVLST